MNNLYYQFRKVLCFALEWHWWTKRKEEGFIWECQICGRMK